MYCEALQNEEPHHLPNDQVETYAIEMAKNNGNARDITANRTTMFVDSHKRP